MRIVRIHLDCLIKITESIPTCWQPESSLAEYSRLLTGDIHVYIHVSVCSVNLSISMQMWRKTLQRAIASTFFSNIKHLYQLCHSGFSLVSKLPILALLPTLYCDIFAVSSLFATYIVSKYENKYQQI